ncbi:MAG: hypothetical protein JWN93_1827, partial [Hyphomicrobiales bacterium]|nr:hypothetical protein [Hyphomicrobiales bacterium]
FDRAAEARDHFLDWEGLDDREADADLERHITRLRALLADAAPDCRRDERGDALLAYASRLLESARKRAPDAALAARK